MQKIKDLVDTQKALKEQKKQCAKEMKNAMKRKKRLQGKASQLSDIDLVEVLRMRKAKKESVQTAACTPPPRRQRLGIPGHTSPPAPHSVHRTTSSLQHQPAPGMHAANGHPWPRH